MTVEKGYTVHSGYSSAPRGGDNRMLSVVVPMYNESQNLDRFFETIRTVLQDIGMEYEIICVNDGSMDDTLERLIARHRHDQRVKIVNLSRNFGKETALTAGINYAKGDAVIPIDADLQDPPELIAELVVKWREGYDVVYAVRRSRQGETWAKKATANVFYRLYNYISSVPIPRNTGDFRLLDRRAADALNTLPESNRFMKGLFSWIGFKQTGICYDRLLRYAGKTSWNYWKLWNFAIEGFIQFSIRPLKIWSYLGFIISLLSFCYASFLVIRTLIFGIDVPGYASLMTVILFMGGLQLIGIGIIGEYLGRVYIEVKKRPLYVVSELFGIDREGQGPVPD